MRREWRIKPLSPYIDRLSKKYNLNPIIVQLLINREIKETDFSSFLKADLDSLESPFLLPDIDKAILRIKSAIKNKEKIMLFGDYDVDGLTSLAIFYDYIKDFSAPFSFYIPHRIKEGYGLNLRVLEKMKKEGFTLLICFDCGTNAFKEIEIAKTWGIDVIVIDHHTPKEEFSSYPYAFVNPKRKDSSYPFKDLSSAGITFKLVSALRERLCLNLVDLVAFSIVCDVVPLKGENRTLLKEGIKWLRNAPRPGIEILCREAGIRTSNINSYYLGYILGPRINASGRISHAREALDVFISSDVNQIQKIVEKLEEYNRIRRNTELEILKEAEGYIERFKDDYVIVVYKDGWHPGVLGIVASRLTDKYWRPVFVIGFDDEIGRGSARSIPQIDLIQILSCCDKFLINYGGHKKACGIEIYKDRVDEFKDTLNTIVEKNLNGRFPTSFLEIDMEITFADISWNLMEAIETLKPFGEDNPRPLFLTRGVFVKSAPSKTNGNKYRFWLSDGNYVFEAMFYEADGFLDIVNHAEKIDIVYFLEKVSFPQVRLIIKDIRLS